MLHSVAVDFKSLAAGEKPDADEPAAEAPPAEYPLPTRMEVLEWIDEAARLLGGQADACEVLAERLKVQAQEEAKKKIVSRLFADAASMREKAQSFREAANAQFQIRRFVLGRTVT